MLPRLPLPLVLLVLLALALPTRSNDAFNGLPLDTGAEAIALLLLLPLLLSAALRRRGHSLRGWRRSGAYAVVIGLVLLKGVTFAGGADGVFAACHSAFTVQPAGSGCERSFADPLRASGATRFDSRIAFAAAPSLPESGWNLDWANRLTFNRRHFSVPSTRVPRVGPPRERLPLLVKWTGTLPASAPGLLAVRYVGEGEISVGGRSRRLPASYDAPRELQIARAAGQREMRATLAFVPSATTAGPYAAFELLDARTREPITAAERHPLVSLVILLGMLGVMVTILWLYGRAIGPAGALRVGVAVVIATLVVVVGAARGFAPEARAAGIATCVFVILAAQAASPRRNPVLNVFLALVALIATTALLADADASAVTYHPFGEDWIAYAGHAHDILRTGSLEAGEPVFYYQPAMRYVLFAGHMLFGSGDVLPVAVAMGLFALAVTLCLVRFVPDFTAPSAVGAALRERLRRSAAPLGALAVVALLFALVHVGMQRFVGYGASEAPTWIVMPAAMALLIGTTSRAAWAAGCALLGALVALRLECLPVALMLWLLFASLPGRRAERLALAAGGLFLALGAIILHNVVYGSEFALVRAEPILHGRTVVGSESGFSALGSILEALWDPTARATLVDHVEAILYLPLDANLTAENLAQRLPLHGLLLAWVAAVAFVTLRWRQTTWIAKGIAALPLAAFGPFLAFDVTTYYPRQIVIGYVVMGVAAIYVLGRGRRSQAGPVEIR